MTPLRVAAIDFLNTAPLVHGLDREPRLELRFTVPSVCADALASGTADMGIVPVAAMAAIPGLVALPGLAIGAGARVRSILLIARGDPPDVGSLALDLSSRTSTLLVQLLLRRRWGNRRFRTLDAAPDWRAMLARADAALLIGDPALRLEASGDAVREGFRVWDLAREWHAWTGLPFVFALWAVRERALAETAHGAAWLTARFHQAREAGLAALPEIADAWSGRLDLPAAVLMDYLRNAVEYDLGPSKLAGLAHFFQLAIEEGIMEPAPLPRLLASGDAS